MDVKSLTKYARISSMKARQIGKEIQGLSVSDALGLLQVTPRKAAHLFNKTLKSAVANAEHNHDISVDRLRVKVAVATTGPVQKRIKPMARGSAGSIRKPTAHLLVVVSDDAGDKASK